MRPHRARLCQRARRPGSSAPASPSAGSPSAESLGRQSSESAVAAAKKSASSQPTKAAKPPKGPSVAVSKVPVGGGVILDDPAQYVVTQPTKGDSRRSARSAPTGSAGRRRARRVIHCDCHQSDFSIKDGSVVHDPAPEPLPEAKVKVFDGKVYVELT